MDQTVCRMHTEPSWVLSLRSPFFPCPPMSKAQRQRKGLHLGSVTAPTEGENSNKVKKGKTEGKKQPTKQGRRKERKYIFWMRKHQRWALPIFRAERAEGLTLVTQRKNNNECYLPSEEVGFVTCDLSLMHRGRQQLVPPPQGKCKLQLWKPLSCLLPSLQTAPSTASHGWCKAGDCQAGSDPSSSITAPFPGTLLQDSALRGLAPAAPPAVSPLTYRWIFPDEGAAPN